MGALDASRGTAARRLADRPATLFLMNVMELSRGGSGLNMARLEGDAVAAQRGSRAAMHRLSRVLQRGRVASLRPRCCVFGLPWRSAVGGPPRGRPARRVRRARSPGRDDPHPLDQAPALGRGRLGSAEPIYDEGQLGSALAASRRRIGYRQRSSGTGSPVRQGLGSAFELGWESLPVVFFVRCLSPEQTVQTCYEPILASHVKAASPGPRRPILRGARRLRSSRPDRSRPRRLIAPRGRDALS
jgi:hypothetical protein